MRRLATAVLLVFAATGGLLLFAGQRAGATVTPYISFQGKLTNTDGTNVTDGTYSIRFRIYTDPTLDGANACSANTCKWEETQASVSVTSGLFQVNLGSVTSLPGSVNFNSNALYLGIKVGSDSEMTPRVQLTSAPQAFNSDMLDGIDSTGFVQLTPGSQQSGNINISGTITSGAINGVTTASAADGFTLAGGTTSRTLTVTGANITVGNTIQPTAAGSLIVQSNGANALTLTSGAAATWSTTAGALTVQGFAGLNLSTPGSTTVSTSAVTIQSGSATVGANLSAGTVSIDTGTTTGSGTAILNVGIANAKTIQIGNNTSNPAVTIDSGTGTIGIGTGAQNRTLNFGTGAGIQNVNVGSTTSSSSLLLQAGTGNLDITTQGGTLNVGVNAVAQTITVGNATGATALTLQSGTGGLIVKPITGNATAFTLQDSASNKYLVADTSSNARLYVGDPAGVAGNPVLLVLASRSTTGDPSNGANGAMYYNSTNSKFRCDENGVWWNCLSNNDPDRNRRLTMSYTDFAGSVASTSMSAPWLGAAISAGTIATPNAGLVTASHQGVVKLSSSITANSGYKFQTDTATFLIGGGESFETSFNITTLANGTFRFGFLDTTTSADATDGVYFEVPSTGAIVGKTASNGTRTTTGTSTTLTAGTWYRAKLVVNSAASRVDFYVYNDSGTQLWTNNLTATIPTASGRETGTGWIATNSGTTATVLAHIDYMAQWWDSSRILTR